MSERAADCLSPVTGVIEEILVPAGRAVREGGAVMLVEAMKMHHEVAAPCSGTVASVAVSVGDQVEEGQMLFKVHAGAVDEVSDGVVESARTAGGDALDELHHRKALLKDSARPEAVEKRRKLGRRTARENIADLCDPGSFDEYGGLAIAAQRLRRPVEELIERTPADGMVCGVGTVNGDLFGDGRAPRCVAMSYDYTVLAGTQGVRNHRKTDRMIDLAERQLLPVILFAEGGGGRPGDTDQSELFHLVVPTFRNFARLSGIVPRAGIASGRCFAGNAALLGCCDIVIATRDATIGMGGPAMIEGGGLGSFAPEDVGPAAALDGVGAIDVLVADEAEAVVVAKRFIGYFQGPVKEWTATDQTVLRDVVPDDPKRVHDMRAVIDGIFDSDSVLELRKGWGRAMITALGRLEGRPVGIVANDPSHLSGAIDARGAEKAARLIQLCDAFGIPVVTLVDTPGFMVGPDSELTGMLRRCSRLFTAAATASVPIVSVIVRRAFGLGAQAMTGGDFHAPLATVAWPSAEFGAMGVEGAVRLGFQRELEAIEDQTAREKRVAELVEAIRSQSGALNMASYFEIDDVIDPSETRPRVAAAIASAPEVQSPLATGARRRPVDTW